MIVPRNWWHKITKSWQHKKGRWVWNQELKSKTKLSEGEKTEIGISLPDGLEITEVYKVQIIDQAGKYWTVKWPSLSVLKKIATKSELDSFTEENEKRIVSAKGYRLGERYFLETNFNTKPGRTGAPCGRGFWFLDRKKYQEKLQNVRDIQFEKFLTAEIEGIE